MYEMGGAYTNSQPTGNEMRDSMAPTAAACILHLNIQLLLPPLQLLSTL